MRRREPRWRPSSYDVEVSTPFLVDAATRKATNSASIVRARERRLARRRLPHAARASTIQNALTGTMNVHRAPRDGGDAAHRRGSTVYVSQPASIDAELRARLPRSSTSTSGGAGKICRASQAYDVRGYGSTLRRARDPRVDASARAGCTTRSRCGPASSRSSTGERVAARRALRARDQRGRPTERTNPLTIAPDVVHARRRCAAPAHARPGCIQASLRRCSSSRRCSVTRSAFDPRDRPRLHRRRARLRDARVRRRRATATRSRPPPATTSGSQHALRLGVPL